MLAGLVEESDKAGLLAAKDTAEEISGDSLMIPHGVALISAHPGSRCFAAVGMKSGADERFSDLTSHLVDTRP